MSKPFAPSGSSVPQRGEPARGVDADQVLGKQDLAPLLVEDAPARVDLIGLEQRVADALALGGEEREAHRPTDHERVDHTQQRFDDAELVGDLGASEHGHERPLRDCCAGRAAPRLLWRAADPSPTGSVRGGPTIEAWARCDAPKASLTYRSMPSTSSRHELGAVALLTGIEPEVLHQLDTGSQLGKPLANGLDRVLRIGLPLGTAEVAGAHHRRAALGSHDRGQRGTDPEVVGDLSVVDRDVEVGAHEHPLAVHVAEVVERRDAVDHQRFFGRLTFEPA